MEASRSGALPGARLLRWGCGIALVVGVAWRLGRYLAQFPVWGDEAFVALNLLDLDYHGLAGPLKYAQVAPLLFLWTEETALNLLGSSELALRLSSVLAGIGALLLFWRLARILAPLQATLAVALFAVSYFPVRHSCEIKPYAFDMFWSVALYWGALEFLRQPERLRGLVALALLVPIALIGSYPTVFAAGGISLALALPVWRQGWRARGIFLLYNLLLVASFVGHYELVGRRQASPEQAQAVHDFMLTYWREAFPPDDFRHWPAWLLDIHTGNLFAYPGGGKHGASSLSFALFTLGALVLWRRGQRALLGVCLLPFALTLLAALLERYPYGGSARVAQHLATPICLLMAAGAGAILECLRSPLAQARWGLAVCIGLAGFGVGGLVYDWRKPFKTFHDFEVRRLSHELGSQLRGDDTVLVCNDPVDVSAEMQWYLRTERFHLCWLDRGAAPPPNLPLWLLFFDVQPAAEGRVLSLLQRGYDGWSPTDCRRSFLPAENNVSKAWYCTRLRLVPPGAGRQAQQSWRRQRLTR
jgi:hypothetical protein